MSLSDLPTLMAAQGFTERDEPISLFEEWLKDAGKDLLRGRARQAREL